MADWTYKAIKVLSVLSDFSTHICCHGHNGESDTQDTGYTTMILVAGCVCWVSLSQCTPVFCFCTASPNRALKETWVKL